MNNFRMYWFMTPLFFGVLSFSVFSATIPKGGVFKYSIKVNGDELGPLDMPLALPIANFFGFTREGNQYSYEEKNSLPIAINIMYIESSLSDAPPPRLPSITDDNFDFSEHYLHYKTDATYSWVSGGKEGGWVMPVINAQPYQQGDPFPAVTTCVGTPATVKEQQYKCKPGMSSSTRNLSMYDELIDVAASMNKPLWVGTLVFPRASDGPEGYTSNAGTGGEGHELVVYLPHRHLALIHLEAVLMGSANGADRRLAAWTLKSDDGEYFEPFSQYNNTEEFGFVSAGNTTDSRTTIFSVIPFSLMSNNPPRMPIAEVAAIHTRLAGGVQWADEWSDFAPGQGIEASRLFTCMNGAKGSVDDYTQLATFQLPDVDEFKGLDGKTRLLPEGQKGFTFEQIIERPPTSDDAYVCDTKGTQLFSRRIDSTSSGGWTLRLDFTNRVSGITAK
ncbi:hypothetical protein ACI2I2_19145 [Scandinavium sp. NPDC088450]|uniref:hypothetical protein n=1 Tax=Scandinavium sp. NPDC088450 TaxID=3364514 RepID=UPI003850B4AC